MTAETARDHLLALVEDHRHLRDSGEALVGALVRLLRRNREAGHAAIRDELLEWVRRKDDGLWAVALEALTDDPDEKNATDLDALLRSEAQNDREWSDQMVLALLRLRRTSSLDLVLPYIEDSVADRRPVAFAFLQHLYALDLEFALARSAQLFGATLSASSGSGMHIQGHLTRLSELGPPRVVELVRRTRQAKRSAGQRLRDLFIAELERPWIRQRLGDPLAAQVSRSLVEL